MAGYVWFGTRQFGQWIAAPQSEVETNRAGYNMSAEYLNGGFYGRKSTTGARKFSFEWSLTSRDVIRTITDYAEGLYGDGPFYYLNPFAADKNALPPYWASPWMNAQDGPLLVDGNRPAMFTDTAITNGYPLRGADYSLTTTSVVPSIFIPVPQGYTAYVGAHGALVSGTSNVTVTPYTGATPGTTVNLTLLAKTGAPTNYTTAAGVTGIVISMKATNASVLRLYGLMVQVRPTGSTAPTGGFISGQGQSGMIFSSQPVTNEYSAVLDKVSITAEMAEVEAWL